MKFAQKFLLGTALLGGLVGIYFLDESRTTKKEQIAQENAVALYFNNADCIKFSMKNENGEFIFERKDSDSSWTMTTPKTVMADQDAVNSTLVLLRNLSVQRALDTPNTLDSFGLTHPSVTFSVTLKNNTTKTLSLGKNLDVNPDSDFKLPSMYAQTSGRTKILVVDNSSLSSFTDKKYDDFRTKQISHFKFSDVSDIVITANNQTLELKLNNNQEWSIVAPQTFAADQTFVSTYLQTFKDLFADNIVESIDQNFFSTQNIVNEQPTALINFKDANQNLLQNIPIYMSKNGLWIRMNDGAFGQIALDKWTNLVPTLKYFRNRELMFNAHAKCDAEFNEVIADDIIDHPSSEDLQKFGLQEPRKTFICHSDEKDEQNSSKTLTISIGGHVPLDEKNVYVKRSDSDSVYIVSNDELSRLAQ